VRDPSVRTLSGKDLSGMIVNSSGRGQAILLNFNLDSARKSVTPESVDAWRSWWREQLSAVGVKPHATLEGTPGQVSLFVAPGLTLVGIMQPQRGPEGRASLRFLDGPSEIYDVIGGQYLGRTGKSHSIPQSG